jgi:hypothetical protein
VGATAAAMGIPRAVRKVGSMRKQGAPRAGEASLGATIRVFDLAPFARIVPTSSLFDRCAACSEPYGGRERDRVGVIMRCGRGPDRVVGGGGASKSRSPCWVGRCEGVQAVWRYSLMRPLLVECRRIGRPGRYSATSAPFGAR